MKICFIASHFFTGGFTSSMMNMIGMLSKQQIHMDLLVLNPEKNEFVPQLPDEVSILNIDNIQKLPLTDEELMFIKQVSKKRIIANIKARLTIDPLKKRKLIIIEGQLRILSKALAQPKGDFTQYDCVISWEELGCNDYLAFRAIANRKIGYIHPDYLKSNLNAETDLLTLEKLNQIVAISEANANILKAVFPSVSSRIFYVPNVIDPERIRQLSRESIHFHKSNFDIVSVCRLDNYSKALDRAVRITERLNQDKLSFHWYIVGEGPSRNELEKQITNLGIRNFTLLGDQRNPYPYVMQSDLFVLQSRYEGRPVSVDEAMILEKPVLITNYASSHEQVTDGYNGLIVENDENAIYLKLKEIIQNPTVLNPIVHNLSSFDLSIFTNIAPFISVIKQKDGI